MEKKKIQISWKKRNNKKQSNGGRGGPGACSCWQAAGSTSAGEYATLIFITEWSQMDCFRIPSVLTEALDQQAACFGLSFTLYSAFSAQLPFWEGKILLNGMFVFFVVVVFMVTFRILWRKLQLKCSQRAFASYSYFPFARQRVTTSSSVQMSPLQTTTPPSNIFYLQVCVSPSAWHAYEQIWVYH